ncbi:unnamed protein product [Linum tenue]|uniref:CCHC-type domain-containing protein n=1 Tax=Linum tenue TaxID=586396 RepID=A0AAV0QRB2_9ROSI|nr:unnamed protein product [Linum tenue]
MEPGEISDSPDRCNLDSTSQANELDLLPSCDDFQSHDFGGKEDATNRENLCVSGGNVGAEASTEHAGGGTSMGIEGGSGCDKFVNSGDNVETHNGQVTENMNGQVNDETEVDMDLVDSPVHVNIQVTEVFSVEEKVSSMLNGESGSLDVPLETLKARSGVKRARMTYEQQQPSVQVMYNSLTRASKKKLEELLQQWSEWHTTNSLYLSFCIDDRTRDEQTNGVMPLDRNSVPLYDRGFVLGLTSADGTNNAERGLEIFGDPARCFNCGAYNHALRECTKPRDAAAINSARKQHMAKRNQNSHSRSSIRYYQSSSGGKYDGLKPGVLDAETRRLLGIGELDPPPWLNRMRELGYPPGYLDADDEEQPSGITIFGEEEAMVVSEEQEEGEIITGNNIPEPPLEPPRKMNKTIEFPGINAPIPENADEKLWAAGCPSSSSSDTTNKNRPSQRSDHSGGRYYHSSEQRWPRRSFMDDDGPPGVDPVSNPSMSSYPPRHGSYHASQYGLDSPRELMLSFARSHSDRERRSPPRYEDSFGSHSSYHHSYQSRYEYEADDRWDGRSRDRPSDYEFEDHKSRR